MNKQAMNFLNECWQNAWIKPLPQAVVAEAKQVFDAINDGRELPKVQTQAIKNILVKAGIK